MQKKTAIHERGNAVTLTLLGLSVAILAGVIVLYFIGKSKAEPVYVPDVVDEETFDVSEQEVNNPREGWNIYTSLEYDFSFEYPSGWIVATGTLKTGDPAITTFPATENSTSTIYSLQDTASHVSVYPQGIATEGIIAETKASDVVVSVQQASSKDYVLTTGRQWATMTTFDVYPQSWSDYGFLFARVVVEEEELVYMRGDTEIEQYEFDPVMGDHIERSGFVDSTLRKIEEEILRSFVFTDRETTVSMVEEKKIRLENPIAGEFVSNPLTVRGEIPREWYIENNFLIRLETDSGEVVTESLITITEEWNEEEYLPFEVSLIFEETMATSGRLILGEDNPIKNEKKLIIPVLFNGGE